MNLRVVAAGVLVVQVQIIDCTVALQEIGQHSCPPYSASYIQFEWAAQLLCLTHFAKRIVVLVERRRVQGVESTSAIYYIIHSSSTVVADVAYLLQY